MCVKQTISLVKAELAIDHTRDLWRIRLKDVNMLEIYLSNAFLV